MRGLAHTSGILPLLAVALACWYLTFAASRPVWERAPGLSLLQFPWRLLGPLGICVAVAGAGALAAALWALERRWGARGRVAGWGLTALVAGAVLVNSVGDHDRQLRYVQQRVIDGRAVVADELRDTVGAGTTSNREFLPTEVQIAVYTVGFPRGRPIYERLYPEADWLGGVAYPLEGDLRVLGWHAGPLRLSVRVANDGPDTARLGIRQLRFAGWRAWLDGRRVPIDAAPYIPEQQISPGFMVVDVPPGEHAVNLAFGPSPARFAGLALTVAGALAATAALAWLARRLAGPGRPGLGLAVAVGGFLAATGVVYLAWRAVRPAFGRFAVETAPVARPVNGVWAPLVADGAGLLVNVAEAVRTGNARVESPTGPALGPDRFVDLRYLTVTDPDLDRGAAATSRRHWLFMHPPAHVSLDVAVPVGRQVWLQAGLALDPAMWLAPAGDGARFQALVSRLDAAGREGPPAVVLDRVINPRARTEHRRWVPVEADLSPWGGSTIRLVLRTLPGDDLNFDWAGWANPVVAVRDFARVRPPATHE